MATPAGSAMKTGGVTRTSTSGTTLITPIGTLVLIPARGRLQFTSATPAPTRTKTSPPSPARGANGPGPSASVGLDDVTREWGDELTRRDKLVTKFRALDADGDDTLSYKEFRRVVVEATRADATPDQKLALDP